MLGSSTQSKLNNRFIFLKNHKKVLTYDLISRWKKSISVSQSKPPVDYVKYKKFKIHLSETN